MVSRREFLLSASIALLAPASCLAARSDGIDTLDDTQWLQWQNKLGNEQNAAFPRTLWVRRGNDEMYIDVYTADGFSRFAWLTRDIRAGNLVGNPDPKIVRQAVWVQARLASYGYHEPLIITSGLRTKHTNETTEGSARASRHLPRDKFISGSYRRLVFDAIDVKLPGVPSSVLASVALEAKDGGVGYYGNDGHVHIDTGPVRFWKGKRHV